ncbi:MAG TPA: tetratricopeptide repeat protein [Gemmatimonadaceae bacterium]|nr:tetratricopeptide repeat protein [Gemmatimonadaceae bacterium]
MKTMLVVAAAISAASAQAQSPNGRDKWADSARIEIEAATALGNLDRLRQASALLERALTALPDDPLLLHYLGYARYREATIMQGMKREEDEYRPLLEAADSLLERSASTLPLAESYAIRSSVLGQLIGSNPLRGMTLGRKSSSAMDRAVEVGPNNPRVWLLRGIGAMFTPSLFGGGLDKAEEYLDKAVALFSSDAPAPPMPAWGHAEAYIWLGQLHRRRDRIDEARQAYNRALELQPDNGWVRHVLLPGLDRAKS